MNLTIEQMREIVDGAPEWAQGFCFELSVYAVSSKGDKLDITCLDDLRAAIADHDRTDHVTDIRNHISPNTRVSEAHVNEAYKLNRLG